ncbi:uncharacterized protein LOC118740001 [Rhagoletis pomonella]|uniref:uncharacterized protein LOC118740001 n=1 Tax=Rhagoletis pomonella TaxID=28610 RepID=UPI001784DF2F|nr:uncharacterized protein LOC118740001 [Rhagoletis pomonella]
MQHIPEREVNYDQCYYIPHHAVTAKFRVVFNASAKSSNGISLYDTQLVGNQLQENLVHILYRFRRFQVAIKADVEKRFRQVEVDKRHRKWQHILWRESPSEQIPTYQLNTVTYGMACGPYNAIRALRQCASDNFSVIHNVNRAAETKESILSNFYVDDYLDSVDTTTVASTESFPSNSDTTVLGLHWNPNNDTLFYKVRLPVLDAIRTKRNVLSDVARLYDPSGLLSPVIVWAKIFIQMLWKAELPWDTPLPGDLRDEWLTFRNGLYQLSSIRVLRWLGMTKKSTVNLHGFCDASSKAYAAVVYVRIEDPEGEVRVSLVATKTRVGPSKSTTIPRMELSAARLLAMTMKEIRHALRLDSAGCMYWSDSTIVLHWIQKAPTVLKPYVANRVAFIQTHSEVKCWRYIRSEHNPADCASRGIPPTALEDHPLWWTGPPIMYTCFNLSTELPALTDEEQQTATKPTVIPTQKRWAERFLTPSVNAEE